MSVFKSNAIALKYYEHTTDEHIERNFNVLSFEDDNVELVKLNKKLLTRNQIEQFIGYRKRYRIRFNKLSADDLDFLYNFAIHTQQRIVYNSDGGVATYNNYDDILETVGANLTAKQSLYKSGDVVSSSGISGSATISSSQTSGTTYLQLTSITFPDSQFTGTININRTVNVKLLDEELAIELLGGFIEAPSIIMEFEDDLLTSVPTSRPYYRTISNTNSGTWNEVNKKGVSLQLIYNYGEGEVGRWFNVNLADSYSINIEKEEFEFIDRNKDRKLIGFYQLFNIEFGSFIRSTEIQKQDDIEWIREYCLAPTKKIYIYGQADTTDVVCDFDEINYELISSNIFMKSLGLRFITQNLQTTTTSSQEVWNDFVFYNWNDIITNWELTN